MLIIIAIILVLIFTKKNESSSSPPEPAVYMHTLSASADCPTACQNIPGTTVVYTNSRIVASNVFLYKNPTLTEPVDNNCYAQALEEPEGVFLNINYQVTNGLGQITNSQFCD